MRKALGVVHARVALAHVDSRAQLHHLFQRTLHRQDLLALGGLLRVGVVEVDLMDAGEQLLQVRLDHLRVRALAQDLEQVLVADEVEAGESASLLLQVGI